MSTKSKSKTNGWKSQVIASTTFTQLPFNDGDFL